MCGPGRLARPVTSLHPEADAESLLDQLRRGIDESGDDMATLVLRATETPVPPGPQVEDLEVEPPDLTTGAAARFLEACGVRPEGIEQVVASATTIVGEHGAAILRVAFGDTLRVQVVPPSAPAIEPRPVTAPA